MNRFAAAALTRLNLLRWGVENAELLSSHFSEQTTSRPNPAATVKNGNGLFAEPIATPFITVLPSK